MIAMNTKLPIVLLLLAFTGLLVGCNQTAAVTKEAPHSKGPSKVLKLEVNNRRYELALPQGYEPTKPYKLLLAFHGSGSNSREMRSMTAFHQYSDEYIIAYPKSQTEDWNEGCDCNKPHRLGVDDLGFVDAVLADIKQHYRIAPGETYAVGFSQGGLFAQNLLCRRSDVFKAVASVASPMSLPLAQKCELATPTSYLMVHGKQDRVLPFAGLEHPRFALIGAQQALALIAEKNASLAKPLIKRSQGVEMTAYWNGQQKTVLYAVEQGRHRWSHQDFATTQVVLDFFASAHTPELPEHSKLIDVDGIKLHVRTMGQSNGKPTVVLLSGPNTNFHGDSAWFALLQNYLAKHYKVLAIDRPGNAWSDFDATTSYRRFAGQLHRALNLLGEQEVVFVAFASSNITMVSYQQQFGTGEGVQTKGMLWIDPDTLEPFSLALYQDHPVSFYKQRIAELLPHIAKGAWTERSKAKLLAERKAAEHMVPQSLRSRMDWDYFDLVSQQRLLIERQQSRALEIAHYYDDLTAMQDFRWITTTPVSVIDSDFELEQIAAAPQHKDKLTRWMKDASRWSELVAQHSGGQYIALSHAKHLVPLQNPQAIATALEPLMAQP